MRVALLADVHGNAAALRAVLADLAEQPVDACWVLGDIFGYGPLPVTCIRMLDDLSPEVWLMGNHDLAALLIRDGRPMEDRAVRDLVPGGEERLIAEWHADQSRVGLTDSRVAALKGVPTWQKVAPGIYAAHGAVLADDPMADRNIVGRQSYCGANSVGCDLTLSNVQRLEDGIPPRLIVVGHVHVPALGSVRFPKASSGSVWNWRVGSRLRFNDGSPYRAEEGADSMMLCPGSVGQPRDTGGANRATYAILELEELAVDFRRIEFDPKETLAAMAPMPRNLYEQLVRARGR
jgi:predicted phosphodiesterase